MNTTIRKVTSVGANDHLVIFTNSISKFESSIFSKDELQYVKSELEKNKKLVCINQYRRYVFLQVMDVEKKERYKVLESCRKAGDQLTTMANKLHIEKIALWDDKMPENVIAFAEGMALGNYQFLKYKSENFSDRHSLTIINIKSNKINQRDIDKMSIIVEATCKARDLVNEPPSFLTATQFSKEFESLAKESGFSIQIFKKDKIKSMGMGGLLAVNAGSIEPPTFSVMEWKPSKAINKKPYILVGKGVVYDTGGLSLKPTLNSMDYMKCDMAGGAVAACALFAIAKADLPLHVIALVPATDNRPGENAYTPGDVITMYSGKKVEVLNSDAEGRMILADALHYAKQYNPELVLEFSTLTGAASVAIGQYGIVCMGTADEKIKAKLNTSAQNVYERLVEFPFWDEYGELIKSDVAEIKNVGSSVAGAITAGKFLEHFIEYPFMHFDIAGPAFIKATDSYRGKNGTGIGVRLLFDFFSNIAKK